MMIFLYFFAIALFMLLCVLLCFIILIQESKSTGLGAAFGGEVSDSLFGASTADVLKKFTAWLALIFFGSCVLLSLWTNALGRSREATAIPEFTLEKVKSL
jgi:preprotein translocase subunit SecG